ncbi:hypothetical protein EBN03_27355 [Nocardia stercoris]|uniref:Sensor domain-containing protein n=1 Tax=Nocardia stercoris TaxID=2483361 RepID=A0A3M2KVX6_9NOCA|nr:hypothetical protein EBN03_27355 [Nocardia stercoris]
MIGTGVLAAVAVVALAGCGSSHRDSLPALGSPAVAPSVIAVPVTDSAALAALLLGTADLPSGYTATDDGTAPAGANPADRSHTEPAACANVLSAIWQQVPGSTAHAAAHFETPAFDSVDIDIASYPGNGAADAFAAVQRLVHGCTSYSGTDADGTAVRYRIGGLSQPPIADASASFQVVTTSSGMSLYSAATVAVTGSAVVQVAVTSPNKVDPGTLQDLTAKQIRRLLGVPGP